ncbi:MULTISPECIES: substrate-binding domain-containing protein [unclassified Neorhizobium]|uniref:sugar ABC transporter substrate-binding protein n=1 Tax=unclassified Neorhizobium TaxID=2629175 RepID=UPI001FF23ADE|nr:MULTISPECIES: substrate-binding domain-containing protein [unclassified Neorhizobium]MCJ9672455.1 substrate-binding domain-containing protein [Neorhizobium sp. SHOUNA12B]MCJ9745065.1 substrate-binding domain-containing protein [Neorhizobium sp. SHOUNA12A]
MKTFMKTTLAAGLAASFLFSAAVAQDLAPLNSDTEKNRMDWSELEAKLGPFPKLPEGTKAGAVSKTLTNEYWRSLGEGYVSLGKKVHVPVVYQAAQSEGDQLGQLTIAEGMITQGYNVLLVSPQTDANLQPVIEQAKAAKIPVVNVNDAVIPQAEHYVGNVQRDNGVRVAKWFIKNRPQGGKVAIVEGQAGVYAAVQRTDGFKSTISEGGKFKVVASVPGNWDRQTSYDAATNILNQHPDLVGFYANNDGMALGIVEAVKAAGLAGKVAVFGTDGISDAYSSIKAGELTGTVDSFPVLTGEVALETALRLVAGQKLPRVVATPQALITADNLSRYQGANVDVRAVLMEDAKTAK